MLTKRRIICRINKQHPFYSKGISKYHPIIVKPLTIRIPQTYTFPRLHYSFCVNIQYQQETPPKILYIVLSPYIPASYSAGPIIISHAGWHKPVLHNLWISQVPTQSVLYLSVRQNHTQNLSSFPPPFYFPPGIICLDNWNVQPIF